MEALLLTSFLYSWHNFRTQNGLPNQALHSFVHASFNFPDWVKGAAFQRKKGTQIWRPAQPARIPESTTLTESQTQVCWEGAFIRPVSLSRSAPPAVLLYSQAKPERAFHFTCSVCTSSVARVSHNREQRRGERERVVLVVLLRVAVLRRACLALAPRRRRAKQEIEDSRRYQQLICQKV